jgi:hypothetical protein
LGEIARYEQFLLFLQCFQKACFPGASKGVIVLEWVKEIQLSWLQAPFKKKEKEEYIKKQEGKYNKR